MYLHKVRFNLWYSAMPYEHLGYNVMYVTLNNFGNGYGFSWALIGS